ncbi:acid ceramidase-like [Gigantopelta aegis]|uniref:acid ceramidase-like n=1 Tax=Gigantopelta aegis TaxID=1735272 RepID=UPI001B88B517|nr:acid ceramidase-like [Gigantopelta aegis]
MLVPIALLGLVAVCGTQLPPGFNVTCVKNTYPPSSSRKVATEVLNLDLPPEKRWMKIAGQHKDGIKNLLRLLKEFIKDWDNSTKIIDWVDKNVGQLDKTLPYPFGGEIKGIADATGLNLGEVVLFNLFYEFFTVCTSIVAEDPSGKLFHARNLDFGLFMGWNIKNHTWIITEALRPLVINVDYQRGGKTVFKAVHFAGYVGVLTGVRPKLFTLSMNERFNIDGGYIGILEWILGERDQMWMGFLTRIVMENATSYTDAEKRLSNTKMLAPAYFILGGLKSGEGSVITRSREASLYFWQMKDAGGWYILETNYDHWKNPLIVDDRRRPANKCMKEMTQKGVSFGGIFDVLSTKPVLNKLTTYAALMQVDSGTLETWLQYCPDPCYPF